MPYTNELKVGAFSSSEIHKLMTLARNKKDFGAPALTYIKEKQKELFFGQPLKNQSYAHTLVWGQIIESYLGSKLPLEYTMCSDDTIAHPTIDGWVGTPDYLYKLGDILKVGDIKCVERSMFYELVHAKTAEELRGNHADKYWQLVSNSILTGIEKCELIAFIPRKKELEEIRGFISNNESIINPGMYSFIIYGEDDTLPHVSDNFPHDNMHVFEFEPLEGDIERLTDTVKRALEILKK